MKLSKSLYKPETKRFIWLVFFMPFAVLAAPTPVAPPAPASALTPEAPLNATAARPQPALPPAPPAPSVKRTAIKKPHTRHSTKTVSAPTPAPKVVRSAPSNQEAKSLLVPDQKYVIRYEDEESFGRVDSNGRGTLTKTFSDDEVKDYRKAVELISDYRNRIKSHCLGSSNRYFVDSLDRYLSTLASFNRRALPLVADITENNNQLMLIVNRTTLVDAPVLTSRYLQFKKQRFKEAMDRFLPVDGQLINSMVTVAKTFKVDITDEDWNKTYGLRDNALEMVSLWPRENIFEATQKLADSNENACIVSLAPVKPSQAEATSPPGQTGE